MNTPTALLLAALCAIAVSARATDTPIDVYFGSRKIEISKVDAKARQAEAGRKAKELEKQLRAQYGKDEDKWPPNKHVELLGLEAEASGAMGAVPAAEFASASAKDLADSAQDLTLAAAGSHGHGMLHVVSKPADAGLVVEVVGRHSIRGDSDALTVDTFGFILRVTPIAHAEVSDIDAIGVWSPPILEAEVSELHDFSAAEPYWELEVVAPRRWKNLADQSIEMLVDFARSHRALFAKK